MRAHAPSLALSVFLLTASVAGAQFSLLHVFDQPNGLQPDGMTQLISDGTRLYGVTELGGDLGENEGYGVVYSIRLDGSDFTVLHQFDGEEGGREPDGHLVLDGTRLYGAASEGGDGGGVLFAIDTDGSDFTELHEFDEPGRPTGCLVLDGATLHGMTSEGGDFESGTLFSIGTDGSGFTTLHHFESGTAANGARPVAGLLLDGTRLYGTTEDGGTGHANEDQDGVVFAIDTDGTGFTILHSFLGLAGDDGADPRGNLILVDGTLYGTTDDGGDDSAGDDDDENGRGTVFSIETDGTSFTLLHEFTGDDGRDPEGALVHHGGRLWGLAERGGADDEGTLYSLLPDGTDVTVHHEFTLDVDGGRAEGGLIVVDDRLLGVIHGPGEDGIKLRGTVLSFDPTTDELTTLHYFSRFDGRRPDGMTKLVSDGERLYGVTIRGGSTEEEGNGTIYALDLNGAAFTVLHCFELEVGGINPMGHLVLDGTRLYGATRTGADFGNGTLFEIDTDGTGFDVIHVFEEFGDVTGCLLLDGTTLYGMASTGGDFGAGVIFSIETDGSGLTVLHHFEEDAADNGHQPVAGLILDGDRLYGTTEHGGAGFDDSDQDGIVFAIDTDGTDFTILHSFEGLDEDDGADPRGNLLLVDGVLFGMTDDGGFGDDDDETGRGTVFSIETDGSDLTLLHELQGGPGGGRDGEGSLLLHRGLFYGLTERGGAFDDGVLFSMRPDGTDFTVLHEFDDTVDQGRSEGALIVIDDVLYGVANGREDEPGAVFRYELDLGPTQVPTLPEWALILLGSAVVLTGAVVLRAR
ncbi:MAG: IPTL-CTERM sorting domain-containing protein [Acidobacteriota bacterium]